MRRSPWRRPGPPTIATRRRELFSEASGVDLAAQKRSVDRAEFEFGPLTDKVVGEQQGVADRFHRLGLIPSAIKVQDIVWDGKSSS